MVAGVTVMLAGFGMFDGKYLIYQAKHSVSNGYTTQIKLRRVLVRYSKNNIAQTSDCRHLNTP